MVVETYVDPDLKPASPGFAAMKSLASYLPHSLGRLIAVRIGRLFATALGLLPRQTRVNSDYSMLRACAHCWILYPRCPCTAKQSSAHSHTWINDETGIHAPPSHGISATQFHGIPIPAHLQFDKGIVIDTTIQQRSWR
jgi:hypothetical protein